MHVVRTKLDIARIQGYVRSVAHAFHTTSGNNILISGEDALGGKHDRLHPAGTDLVNGGSIGPMLHPGSESDLTSRGLTNSSLHDIAKEDLLDFLRRDVILLKCMFQGDGTKFGRGEGFERTVQGAYWCPRCSDDDCFPWAKGGLNGLLERGR